MGLQAKRLRIAVFVLFSFMLIAGVYAQVQMEKAPTIIKSNGKFGVCDKAGNLVIKPLNDTVYTYKNEFSNPFFILKQGEKIAYAYYVYIDSVGNKLDEKKQYWHTSEFMYDDIKPFRNHGETYDIVYDRNFKIYAYDVFQYKKEGKWGLIYIKSRQSPYKDHIDAAPQAANPGELTMTEGKYDTIVRYFNQEKYINSKFENYQSGVYVVKLNGKFEFLEVIYRPADKTEKNMSRWSNELYKNGDFDTIPLQVDKKMYVRKNGKWGQVLLHDETKTTEYTVPCMCRALFCLNEQLYYCGGEKDTLKFYNTVLKKAFVPLPEQKPVICTFFWSPDNSTNYTAQKYIGSRSMLKAVDGRFYKPEDIDDTSGIAALMERYSYKSDKDSIRDMCYENGPNVAKRLFVFDMGRNTTVASFVDTGSVYQIHHEDDFIIKANYDRAKKTYVREFYDARTGFYKFKIETADKHFYMVRSFNNSPLGITPKIIDGVAHHWYQFESEKTKHQKKRKNLGTYDLTTGEYNK